jgi:hypothetical protein
MRHQRPHVRPLPYDGGSRPQRGSLAGQTVYLSATGVRRRRPPAGCGPEGRGFESPRSPQASRALLPRRSPQRVPHPPIPTSMLIVAFTRSRTAGLTSVRDPHEQVGRCSHLLAPRGHAPSRYGCAFWDTRATVASRPEPSFRGTSGRSDTGWSSSPSEPGSETLGNGCTCRATAQERKSGCRLAQSGQ